MSNRTLFPYGMKKNLLPLISIIIPSRNSEATLRLCLSAIKKQTYTHIEVIIVDSYSTDKTVDIAKSYVGTKIYSYEGGLLGSRILGIQKSKGIYVLLLDSDQILSPSCVKEAVDKAQEKGFQMLALQESVYEVHTFLQWLFACDRKIIESVGDINPETSAILPRFFLTSLIIRAVDDIPKGIISTVGGPDHAILYYESWKISKKVGIVLNAVKHMEASSIVSLFKKCYRWGYTGYSAKTQSDYKKLMRHKERFRVGLFTNGLYVESMASILLLILKGIPYMFGYWHAIINHFFKNI